MSQNYWLVNREKILEEKTKDKAWEKSFEGNAEPNEKK
jgi:hypothetical protein